MTGAMAPVKPLTALDLCDRCGAQAYMRVVLPGGGELLFCAHHGRQHGEALARIAAEIQTRATGWTPARPRLPATKPRHPATKRASRPALVRFMGRSQKHTRH